MLERSGDGGHVLGQGVVDAWAAQPLDAFQRSAQHLAHQPQAQLVHQPMADLHQQPLRGDPADEQQHQQASEQQQALAEIIQTLFQATVDVADQTDTGGRAQGTAQHREENTPPRVMQQFFQ